MENASKYHVVISMYPLNSYIKGKYRFHTNVNILDGSEKDVQRFIKNIQKDKRCLEFKGSGNVYLSHMKMKTSDFHTTNYYTPKIFLLKPIVHKDGKEDWYFGAWEKKIITELFKTFQKYFNVELLSIEEKDFTDVFLPQIMPQMTFKQKEALHLAINEGYYNFPKKTDLEQLAKLMHISIVTFREHLRKAESKILPKIFGAT
ncbi:helix-turn-helix domain-containing protein [Candidatus Woesearchaeota archaeon]|nr:helix-turn-helix domain-containing protein [Candidatus Woesearchaeota archaeon]